MISLLRVASTNRIPNTPIDCPPSPSLSPGGAKYCVNQFTLFGQNGRISELMNCRWDCESQLSDSRGVLSENNTLFLPAVSISGPGTSHQNLLANFTWTSTDDTIAARTQWKDLTPPVGGGGSECSIVLCGNWCS